MIDSKQRPLSAFGENLLAFSDGRAKHLAGIDNQRGHLIVTLPPSFEIVRTRNDAEVFALYGMIGGGKKKTADLRRDPP